MKNKTATGNEARKHTMNELQQKILEIYKEIKKLCDKHHLRYFAIGGTCLGAVRHKGFIPWVDDMDIAMPDKDYKRFMEIADKELPDHLNVIYSEKIKRCTNTFNKVQDINTTFISSWETDLPELYKGIYVDIMPLCGLPPKGIKQKVYIRKNKMLYALNYWKRINIKPRKSIPRVLYLLTKPLNCLVAYDFWSNRLEKMREKYSFDTSEYVGFTWSFCPEKRIFKQDLFDRCVDLPFEDTTMPCPQNYHEYLTQHFGDYSKIPPESEQKGRHGEIVDIHRPYTYYLAKKGK